MPVSVPVRIENGSAQPQLARLDLEPWQMSLPTPRYASLLGPGQGEVQARLHIVTLPDGRADRTASGVESLEILPVGPVAVERALRKHFMEAIGQAHMDPVLVDGKGISLEFWRSYFAPFCVATTSCTPERHTSAPPDPPVKLPEGIELARVKP
jgi:hypothetical protein